MTITTTYDFFARHGVLPQERTVGGRFAVRLRLELDDEECAAALVDDRLDGTVNYADVYALVREEMEQPAALLEHVAHRVARRLVSTFPLIKEAEVGVTKRTPPITGCAAPEGVTVMRTLRRQLAAWDFDGTIADTSAGIVRTMAETFRRLGRPVATDEAVCATIGLPLPEGIHRLLGIEGAELEHAVDVYRELFEEVGTQGVTLFPTVGEKLRRQHELGITVGIATSRGHESVEQLCTALGIRPYIDHIVGVEDVSEHKPAPTPVLRLCEMAHVAPRDTTVFGDTTFDIEMGRRAGAPRLVGVSWGNHTPEQLRAAGATEIVTRF